MDPILRQSRDNFYKKVASSKGFAYQQQTKGDIYSTLIHMLKNDLLQIQEMINANISDIKMYKILSKQPGLTRKLKEIEDNTNIIPLIEKIGEEGKNLEKIGKMYNCQSMNELVQKIAIELNYNELLLKKICDFCVIMKLKMCNDDTFQDSLSKIIPLKTFIEKIASKMKSGNEREAKEIHIENSNSSNAVNPKLNKIKEEYDEFMKLSTLNELFDCDKKNKNLFEHVYQLIMAYFKNLNFNLNETLMNNNDKKKNVYIELKGSEVDKYFKLKEEIENILNEFKAKVDIVKNDDAKEKIDIMKRELEEKYQKDLAAIKESSQKEIQENQKKISELQEMLASLEREKNTNNKQTNQQEPNLKYTEKDLNEIKMKLSDQAIKKENELNKEISRLNELVSVHVKEIERLKKEFNERPKIVNNTLTQAEKVNFVDAMKKHEEMFKKSQMEINEMIKNEVKDYSTQLNKLKETMDVLQSENANLKKQLNMLNSKNFNADSYEQVLLEQFETMKKAFMKKVEDLTDELSQTRSETRAEVYHLKQELQESNKLKNIFLQQVLQMQKQLGI